MVVRGEPGTGTTRAAWEAVAGELAEWPLEYPRTAAALAARLEAGIPAGTVLWLGELGRYVHADDGAAALRLLDLLLDNQTGYLAVATIWPWQWDACIAAVRAGRGTADPAWRAGRMLGRLDELSLYALDSISPDYGGGFVDVQARFTAGELAAAAGSGDPVLAAAAAARPWGAGHPVPGRRPRAAEPLRGSRRRPGRPGDPYRRDGRHPARPLRPAAGRPARAGRGRLPVRRGACRAARHGRGQRAGRGPGLGLRRGGRRGRRSRCRPLRGGWRIPAGGRSGPARPGGPPGPGRAGRAVGRADRACGQPRDRPAGHDAARAGGAGPRAVPVRRGPVDRGGGPGPRRRGRTAGQPAARDRPRGHRTGRDLGRGTGRAHRSRGHRPAARRGARRRGRGGDPGPAGPRPGRAG